ncbi:A disintegrin and metalloproteinase with thrombospondin motifs 12-like isoform X1 [Leptopilina heterotoma]|uniref:A disintegrin and metalloproteinase with thrombospondin motifs 12-like isoform X1 n=2 Tax=Leptopilina heterotoma TaxID=63436 RepID=UPI001CA8DA27|nr:A disintegrin and metalloproteinase with thrombospondin motifs 12-like isoform X1 [Leptopilina heterotoma]
MRYLIIFHVIVLSTVAERRSTQTRGMYTSGKHMVDLEVIFPRKVTQDGKLISYDTTHLFGNNSNKDLHLHFTRANIQYHLHLTPVLEFISPKLIIERRKKDIHVRHPINSNKCHYRGYIRGQANSRVALSACNGLAGVIQEERGEFWLEPIDSKYHQKTNIDIKSANPLSELSKPHILYRRSSMSSASSKRRPNRRRKKKISETNCGTSEPRGSAKEHLKERDKSSLSRVQGRGRRMREWQRAKRSISKARHVETLVVADSSMTAFHQDGDVETYLLTIMNMVSALYLHPSIGNFINVVVVRIILIEEDELEEGLNVSINAEKTLINFCKWQEKLKLGDDTHPNHHDVAILITREDICTRSTTPCSTLGVAHVAGMCQTNRSCSVNEDNGITLAHTIAHELGHNFGMYHDTEKMGCNKRNGNTLHVMTPTFDPDAMIVAWSRCSRRDITNFLDKGKGKCLEDEPADNDYAYPDLPAGAMYNAEHQCRLQFGVREASVCSPLQEICSKLWCVVNGTCTSMLHPAAPGTHCGKHMWCENQECVPMMEKPIEVDGGWGEWGPWSECSRSCGGGVSIMERECDHPPPANGGQFCLDERRRYKICNVESCPEDAPSFRNFQCNSYNEKEYKNKNYTWLPYFDKSEPCELYCTDTDEEIIVPLGEAFDGTPCNLGSRDMCIAGLCRKVGCDWKVDSNAMEDRCGICHGDGTQCETISGSYDNNEGVGYKEIIVIPAGSRNVKIEEVGENKNYISIGVPNSEKYFLNGQRQITLPGEYLITGTYGHYEREEDMEKVTIPGPIREDIAVYIIYRGTFLNFSLKYEYTVPKNEINYVPYYSWVFSDWSLCTATCGGGLQTSYAFCEEVKSGIVGDQFCNKTEKPESIDRECNSNLCPARWWVGPWQICPITCGEGASRKRSVMCVTPGNFDDTNNSITLALPDEDCDKKTRPEEVEPCPNLPPCGGNSEVPFIINSIFTETVSDNVTPSEHFDTTDIDTITSEKPDILEFSSTFTLPVRQNDFV